MPRFSRAMCPPREPHVVDLASGTPSAGSRGRRTAGSTLHATETKSQNTRPEQGRVERAAGQRSRASCRYESAITSIPHVMLSCMHQQRQALIELHKEGSKEPGYIDGKIQQPIDDLAGTLDFKRRNNTQCPRQDIPKYQQQWIRRSVGKAQSPDRREPFCIRPIEGRAKKENPTHWHGKPQDRAQRDLVRPARVSRIRPTKHVHVRGYIL